MTKSDLPSKICPVCGLPFTWRKKWERNWDSVIYCSDKCRSKKNQKRCDRFIINILTPELSFAAPALE